MCSGRCWPSPGDRPVGFDAYAENRDTGGFVLIDRMSNATVAAGMIHFALRRGQNIHKKARRGELKNFTGIDSSYEVPESPELRLANSEITPELAVGQIIALLKERGCLG